jgi:hypothetical protein
VDAARVTGRGTWGPARRARCRAPGTTAPHAGARARGGGWCAGYAERKADQGAAVESRERGAPLARLARAQPAPSGAVAKRGRHPPRAKRVPPATTEHVYSRAQVVARDPQQAA